MIELTTLINLAKQSILTEQDERILIMYYIFHKTGGVMGGVLLQEVVTAVINNKEQWKTNVEIAKNWFKTIET